MTYVLLVVVAGYAIYIAANILRGAYRGDTEVKTYHLIIAVVFIIAGIAILIGTFRRYLAEEKAAREKWEEEKRQMAQSGEPDEIDMLVAAAQENKEPEEIKTEETE